MSQKTLRDYQSSEPTNSQTDAFPCPTCERVFDSNRGVKVHHKRMHGSSIAGVETTCEWCNTTFRKPPSEAGRSENDFCSYECNHNWQSKHRDTKVTIECEWCGGSFREKPGRAEDRRFCSNECFGNHFSEEYSDQVTRPCRECRTDVTRCSSHMPDDDPFCSRECFYNWRSKHYGGEQNPCWDRIEITCDWCETSYFVQPSSVSQHNNNYCSSECQYKGVAEQARIPRAELTCEFCGDSYMIPQREADSRRFCSLECWREYSKTDQWCGPNNPRWNGGYDLYTRIRGALSDRSWDTIAEEVRERYDYCCQSCGAHQSDFSRKLDVHHIIGVMAGGDNGDYNLIPLCRSCHPKTESYLRDLNPRRIAE